MCQRELAEEAGVKAQQWEALGQIFSSPGVLTEVIHVFLARGLSPCEVGAEPHEVFESRWVPLVEAASLAADGRLQDAKTIAGLVWAQTRIQSEKGVDRRIRSKM